MIPERLAWFCIGAMCAFVICGWPWHPRFSRYSRPCRQLAEPTEPTSYGWGPRQVPPPTPAPGMRREYLYNPREMVRCGGPCWEAQDPCYCTCGALWRDVPIKPWGDRVPQPMVT
jgi:hypothetical protein